MLALRITRPYSSAEDYLAAEAWTLGIKYVVLVDQEPLEQKTPVRFEIVLENGEKLVRAEATVVGAVAAEGDRPGGVRVRLRRIGAATKRFLDRALAQGASPPNEAAPSAAVDTSSRAREHSGVQKVVLPPPDRDALLQRLRERALRRADADELHEDAG